MGTAVQFPFRLSKVSIREGCQTKIDFLDTSNVTHPDRPISLGGVEESYS